MKATYHANGQQVILDVLQEHSDGTVDLGHGDTLKVRNCPVADKALNGHCTIDPKERAEAAAAAKAKAKAEADAAAKANAAATPPAK